MDRTRIPYLYLLLFPWLVLGETALFVSAAPVLWLILGLVLSAGSIGAAVSCARISVRRMPLREAALWHLGTKLSHLPVHVGLFLVMMGMLNPWLWAFLWIPLGLSGILLWLGGIAHIGICIRAFREDRIGKGTAVLWGILAFVYAAGIVSAVWELVRARRERGQDQGG